MQIAIVRESACSPGLGADDLGALRGRRRRRRRPIPSTPPTRSSPPPGCCGRSSGSPRRLLRRLSPGRLQLLRRLRGRRRQLRRRGDGAGRRIRLPRPRVAAAERPGGERTGCERRAARPAGRARRPGRAATRSSASPQSQLGARESPPGSNCNPYGPCVEWCSLFVAWVWKRAGRAAGGRHRDLRLLGLHLRMGRGPRRRSLRGDGAGRAPLLEGESNGARVLPPTATPAPGDAVLYGTGPDRF